MLYEKSVNSPIGKLTILPLSKESQIIGHENYLYDSPADFLEGIGFDTRKFSDRIDFRKIRFEMLKKRLEQPSDQRTYYVVFAELNNEPVSQVVLAPDGDSSTAHAHFHIWRQELRHRGLGELILKAGLSMLMDLQNRRSAFIEPHRDNEPMNKLMEKCGFEYIGESRFCGDITHDFPSKKYRILRDMLNI